VTVDEAPTVSVQPAGLAACVGQPVQLSLVASGSPTPSFQWRKNGLPILGATSSSLSIASYTLSDAGSYDCQLSNACGSTTSALAFLTTSTGGVCIGGGAGGAWPAPGRGGRRLAGLPADGPALEFALGHAARGCELDLGGAAPWARARLVG
jgi:hypothetical protein